LTDESIATAEVLPTDFIWWFYNNVQQDARLYKLCGVSESDGVHRSDGVNWSVGVSGSNGVNESDGVSWSNGVSGSDGVSESIGVRGSFGVSWSFGVIDSYGADNALFLANKPRAHSVFGKDVTQARFDKIKNVLCEKLNGWTPTFNNIEALYLASGSDWKLTPIQNAEELQKEESWRDMPKEAIAYLRSLPEFDAGIFEAVTGIKTE
jgi:hypothetical protein